MNTYAVPVRNESTGEVRVVEVLAGYGPDAQVQALHTVFESEGWRRATALLPDILIEAA
ncbi:MAG: hypothetical protein ACR2JC_15185 [Chloroflexota bacterium]